MLTTFPSWYLSPLGHSRPAKLDCLSVLTPYYVSACAQTDADLRTPTPSTVRQAATGKCILSPSVGGTFKAEIAFGLSGLKRASIGPVRGQSLSVLQGSKARYR